MSSFTAENKTRWRALFEWSLSPGLIHESQTTLAPLKTVGNLNKGWQNATWRAGESKCSDGHEDHKPFYKICLSVHKFTCNLHQFLGQSVAVNGRCKVKKIGRRKTKENVYWSGSSLKNLPSVKWETCRSTQNKNSGSRASTRIYHLIIWSRWKSSSSLDVKL